MSTPEEKKKCHNCKGTGIVKGKDISGKCYYCQGKGYRNKYYGRDS